MSRTVTDLDDEAVARAAVVLGNVTTAETVNAALRAVAEMRSNAYEERRFADLLDLVGKRLGPKLTSELRRGARPPACCR